MSLPTSVELVDAGVADQVGSGLAGTGEDVDHPCRQVGLLADLGEQQSGQRGGLGRFEDHGVSGGQGGCDLPRQHQEREVPRDHLSHDADGAGALSEAGVLKLVGPARVIEEVRRGQRDVDVA
jgi:hypothetical protein